MVRLMALHGFVTSQTMVIDFNRFMFSSLPPIVFPQNVEKNSLGTVCFLHAWFLLLTIPSVFWKND